MDTDPDTSQTIVERQLIEDQHIQITDEAIKSQQLVADNDSQALLNENLEIENENLDTNDKNHNPSSEKLFDDIECENNEKGKLVSAESTSSSDSSETAANNVVTISESNSGDVKRMDAGVEIVNTEIAIDMQEVEKNKCEPSTSKDDSPVQVKCKVINKIHA